MSTFISEPGTRLGGRYRLEDRINAAGGWAAWKAIDETLARPVTVLTFAPGFPRIREAVTAARAASRLTDARLTQVFDVEDNWDHAYVVMEWVAGDSLEDLLADGPLDPAHGAEMVAESAEALAVAHAAGVAHLCLNPASLRWTPGGGVKLVGLGIDAALSGTTADDPALADTQGLARLLYAALTAHWPGADWPALPSAPVTDGRPCSPRQVCAGVPAAIDDITCEALFQRERRGVAPLTTPAQLAEALVEVIPAPLAPPPAAAVPSYAAARSPRGAPARGRYWDQDGPPPGAGPGRPAPPPARPGNARVLLSVVAVLLVAAAAFGGYKLIHRPAPASHSGSQGSSQQPSAPAARVTVLTPVSASGYDPLTPVSGDAGNENTNEARYAIDKSPTTAWHTQYYEGTTASCAGPTFGCTKAGAGLLLDMGSKVSLSSVRVTFGPTAGADVQIKVGNSNDRSASGLSSFTTVASASDVPGGTYTFHAHGSATGQYVLIWFTKLPPLGNAANRYEAAILNVAVTGTKH